MPKRLREPFGTAGFRATLAEQPRGSAAERWHFVPYDQLHRAFVPSEEGPVGVLLIESIWKAGQRPYHRQKLALVLANQRHFALELAVCPPPERLQVDAWMPAHRHGMNYRPTVRHLGGSRYRAEGLLFHMPGRWEFLFELRAGGETERFAHAVRVE